VRAVARPADWPTWGALPPELVKLGHEVSVYLPLYARVRPLIESERRDAVRSITIPSSITTGLWGLWTEASGTGLLITLWIARNCLTARTIRTRAGDYPDNAERFGLFCRAVLEAAKLLGVPDVFHVHDWQRR